MTIRWRGLVAPEEAPTGDRRMFASNSLTFRDFPNPAAWQRVSGSGHAGSVVVASWDGWEHGEGGIWGYGTFLDPAIVPEVIEAIYLLEKRLIGPSVDLDPDLAFEVVDHPVLAGEYAMKVTRANVHGLTFVMGPAFPQVHITVDSDEEMEVLVAAGINMAEFAVTEPKWTSWPIAERETEFDADSAITRIAEWSGGDPKKFGSAFLWRDDEGDPNNRETYRLPVADVIEGKLVLIPRAVFSAATILSGAHGGLENTVPEDERIKLEQIVTEMYDMLREQYGDPRVKPPWQRGGRDGATSSQDAPTEAGIESITAAGLLKPPIAWFGNPHLSGPTKLKIDDSGRVFGHLANWKVCHLGVGRRCVLAPRSLKNYEVFKTGQVMTAEDKLIDIGKITLGTGHANQAYGVVPAMAHYENTGTCVAVVNAGEDAYGIWVAGALVAGVDEKQVAELRRSPLSGDWRKVDGHLELCAALAVNNPGYPIAHEESGNVVSLVAAGMIVDESPDTVGHAEHILAEVDRYLEIEDRAMRRRTIENAYADLLGTEGCGCDV